MKKENVNKLDVFIDSYKVDAALASVWFICGVNMVLNQPTPSDQKLYSMTILIMGATVGVYLASAFDKFLKNKVD